MSDTSKDYTSSRSARDAWRKVQRDIRRAFGLDEREVLCRACDHPMRMTESYHPVLYEYVPAWACDNCGRTVVRDDPYDVPNIEPDDEF